MSGDVTTRGAVSVALELRTLSALQEFCGVLAKTDMVPKAYKDKPGDILVAMLHGQEVGLPHLQALQSIAVVNGIPSIYGDAALAMVRASGKLDDFDEWIEVDGVRQDGPFPILKWAEEGKNIVAYCRSKRVGMARQRITSYSVDDAQRSKLWLRKGHNGFETPWCTVPQRMLMWRARGWNLRDNFGDVLKGLAIYEEAMDIDMHKGSDGTFMQAADPEMETNKAKLAEGREKLRQLQEKPQEIEAPKHEQPQQAQPAQAEPSPSGQSEHVRFNRFSTRLREAENVAQIATVMNEALNGQDSLLATELRQSITAIKDECLAKMRKRKS